MSCGVRRFDPQELDRQRQQALSGMRVNYEDPDSVASLVFDRLVYGFHPYGLPNTGTPESLSAITVDDLRAFHKTWFVPNNAILGIVGDITTAEALAAAEKAFGDWQPGDAADGRASGAAAADPPRGRRQQARRGADRGPRRPRRAAAHAPGLPGVRPGAEDPGRRRRQSPAPGAAIGSRADLRRVGRPDVAARVGATSRPRPTRGRTRPARCCG